MDLLGFLELRGLLIDDDLGGILHQPGPAEALRHLHDGELALVGEVDDIGGHVLDEPGGLDEERGGSGQHHPTAELPLPFDIALHGEHGRQHQFSA